MCWGVPWLAWLCTAASGIGCSPEFRDCIQQCSCKNWHFLSWKNEKKNIYIFSKHRDFEEIWVFFFKKKWFSLNPSGKSYKLIKSSNFPYDFTKLAKKIAKTRRKIESSRKSIKNAHTWLNERRKIDEADKNRTLLIHGFIDFVRSLSILSNFEIVLIPDFHVHAESRLYDVETFLHIPYQNWKSLIIYHSSFGQSINFVPKFGDFPKASPPGGIFWENRIPCQTDAEPIPTRRDLWSFGIRDLSNLKLAKIEASVDLLHELRE